MTWMVRAFISVVRQRRLSIHLHPSSHHFPNIISRSLPSSSAITTAAIRVLPTTRYNMARKKLEITGGRSFSVFYDNKGGGEPFYGSPRTVEEEVPPPPIPPPSAEDLVTRSVLLSQPSLIKNVAMPSRPLVMLPVDSLSLGCMNACDPIRSENVSSSSGHMLPIEASISKDSPLYRRDPSEKSTLLSWRSMGLTRKAGQMLGTSLIQTLRT